MKADFDLILDLATDSTSLTREQLITAIKNKMNGTSNHFVTILSTSPVENPFQHARSIISEDTVDLLYKAKCKLDDAGVTDVVIVTTLIMKKYWENLCVHMFAAVHNWSVLGVDVSGQVLSFDTTKEIQGKELFKKYLTTLGNIDEVVVLRSGVISNRMFNAGFHERCGGVSRFGPLASMNMFYTVRKPDPLLVVRENHRRLAVTAGFDLDSLHVTKVEHGNKIWVFGKEEPRKYDGIVTNIPGVTVAAPGADCCVILLADPKTGACGAVHSGWRGTTLGAVRSCLQAMVEEFGTDPKDVSAALGPSIEGSCFTLPTSSAASVIDLDPSLAWPVENEENMVYVDLIRANVLMLEKDGVPRSNIDTSHAVCTVCNKQFFSYQRDSVPFGNQFGFISCRKPNS